MKLRISLFVVLSIVCGLFLLASQQGYSIEDPPCPSDNCVTREVSEEDDHEANSLRWVVNAACRDDKDDRIIFSIWDPVELDSPIVIPHDCNGRVFIYGKANVRNVINGSALDIGDDFTDNCILRVESDDNEITDLSFVNYHNGDEDEVEKRPGIGLCLIGNRNRVEHISSGITPESASAGNDVGVYIAGDENAVLHSRISFNTLDGIWIEGDKNVIQGNYIADAEEDCSQPSEPEKSEDALTAQDDEANDEVTPADEVTVEDEDAEKSVAEDQGAVEDAAIDSTAGGCQLVPSTTTAPSNSLVKLPSETATSSGSTSTTNPLTSSTGLSQSFTNIITTPGVLVLDTEKPRNAKVESATQVSEDELATVRQAQSQSCVSISNGRYGIRITGNASDNKIGGFNTGEHNIIAYNGADGIRLDGTNESLRNTINHNVFYHNGELGIDAGPDGVTYNDAGDVDVGPNTLINYADHLQVIMRTLRVGEQNTYTFTLKGQAPVDSLIEVYLADGSANHEPLEEQGDPSGYGEGEMPLMHFIVQGAPAFEVQLPRIVQRQRKVTTLLTDPDGNTSEFSRTLLLEQDTDLDGIIDLYEDAVWNELVDSTESDPFNIDTDGDGLLDGVEDPNLNGKRDQGELPPQLADADKDGLSDYIETKGDGSFAAAENDTDPFNKDTDGDGVLDGKEDKNHNGIIEFHLGETDPRHKDSDGDGIADSNDNCPTMSNQNQRDRNNNNTGDVCEVLNNP